MNLKILNELDRILKHNPTLKTDKHAFCQVVNGIFDIDLKKIDYSSNGHGSMPELSTQIDKACLHKSGGTVRFGRSQGKATSGVLKRVGTLRKV